MQTIQLEVPDDLAVQLRPYRNQLLELLEAGLRALQQPKPMANENVHIQRILAVSGCVRLPKPYAEAKPYVRHTPVPITGQSVSEIAIEQRGEG